MLRRHTPSIAVLVLLGACGGGQGPAADGGEDESGGETEAESQTAEGSDTRDSEGSATESSGEATDGTCTPAQCDALGFVCGEHPDGCGGMLTCGACDLGDCVEGQCIFEPSTQFDDDPITWSVPDGGEYLAGFDALGGSPGGSEYETVGAQAWATTDLDGDGLVDLVVTAEAVEREGYYWWSRVLGHGDEPHWLVYRNTGEGFADEPLRWSVPRGGEHLAGFDALAGVPGGSEYATVGAQAWTTTDIDGDGLLDLVVTAEAVEREGYYWWAQVLGYDGEAPHWNVYFNTGDGFANEPTAWSVPQGGEYLAGFDALAGEPGGSEYAVVGADAWTTTDIDGDGRPDLVVTARAVEREGYYWWARVLGYGDAPHWNVYLNTGRGFEASPSSWSVPDGGQHLAGFDALGGNAGESAYETVGAQEWSTSDIDGDGRLDLVVTAEATEREGYYWWSQVLGYDEDEPHWNVHFNTGDGFAAGAEAWPLPAGGEYLAGFDALAGSPGGSEYATVGAHAWATIDVDGDRLLDLIVTAEAVEREGYYWWAEVLGFGNDNPHWNVYRNTGSGFAAMPASWSVPSGGEYLAGFDALGGSPGGSEYAVVGSDGGTATDLDGDGRIDLVVTARAVEREGYYWWARVLGYEGDPRWNVHVGRP
jgi:hypothetical protein